MITSKFGQSSPFLTTTAFLVLCLIVAQVINPAAKLVGMIIGWLLRAFGKQGFTSIDFAAQGYPEYLARLVRDPLSKAHWEWELFLFYQRRSAVVSFFVWVALLGLMRIVHWGPVFQPAFALELAFALLLFIAITVIFAEGSIVMKRTHELYKVPSPLPEEKLEKSSSDL